MDAALVGVIGTLVGVGGTLLGSAIAASVTLFANRFAADRADRREERRLAYNREQADKQRTHERDLKRQEQLLQERLSAYMELAKLTRTIDPNELLTFVDMAAPLSRIELVAGDGVVFEAANSLYGAVFWARDKARTIHRDEGRDPTEDEEFLKLYNEKEEKRKFFIEVAKRDLAE
jgi:hypothetical protein